MALEKGFEETEKHITNESAKNKTESGTTAASIILKDEMGKKELFVANLGDTESILVSVKERNEPQIFIEENSLLGSDGGDNNTESKFEFLLLTEKHFPGLK